MAEIITGHRKKDIPNFASYPLDKSKLEEYLCTTPQETIELLIMPCFSDTGFEHNYLQRRKTLGVKQSGSRDILRTFFGLTDERWVIWIHPVRKTILEQIKATIYYKTIK